MSRHGKAVCGSVRCSESPCVAAYRRTVDALGVDSLGQQDHAYVDVIIYMVGGAGHEATLTREDVDNLCSPAYRKRVNTFAIPTVSGGRMNLFTSMITSIEEISRDDY
ncbi:hypothetical protein SEA_LUCKYSOCKE_214 [Streptomyces phage LuckySocke]|nr:hypothetical protein SEA_LUCKYSOCKE_214 [Streptomyces phage LuckySocke]